MRIPKLYQGDSIVDLTGLSALIALKEYKSLQSLWDSHGFFYILLVK